jgi:hypothetical protein
LEVRGNQSQLTLYLPILSENAQAGVRYSAPVCLRLQGINFSGRVLRIASTARIGLPGIAGELLLCRQMQQT